jgi:hypothetical protein
MEPQAAKQQIVERIKQAENILVTVSADPSVDQLASCIGFALFINKLGKSATAVFSGKTPSTIEFLQPEKMLTSSPDSLRDFIISLDKEKADKLRYKVEDQVVRIFITPYKTKLTQNDLNFSEGDFNVDVIVTLGVLDRAHLDTAITAHGRILHDATVIALSAGQGKAPDLGQINWQDPNASSLSEMLVSLSEAFGSNLIDNQSATAFLTGIVAETDRFSNKKTSPKVMTMSAQLMAAGANQQLVISKLTPAPPPAPKPLPPPVQPPKPKPAPPKPEPPKPAPLPPPKQQPKPEPPKPAPAPVQPPKEEKKVDPPKPNKPNVLNVAHDGSSSDEEEVEINTSEIHIDPQGNIKLMQDGINASEPKKDEGSNQDKEQQNKQEKPKPKTADEPLPMAEVHIVSPHPSEKANVQSIDSAPPPPPPIPEQQPPAVKAPPPIPTVDSAPPPMPSAPPVDDLAGLPPLPPPMPTPHIQLDKSTVPPHISSQSSAPSSPLPPPPGPPPEQHSSHAVLDPLRQAPHLGASFSADTGGGIGTGSNMNVDPVNNVPMNPSGGESYSQAREVAPPSNYQNPLDKILAAQGQAPISTGAPAPAQAQQQAGSLTPETARQAVEDAYNTVPFNPANNPQQSVGAEPMGPVIHQPPPYDNGTPSLNLPTPPGAVPVAPPPAQAPPPLTPPPPTPPPFMPPPTL